MTTVINYIYKIMSHYDITINDLIVYENKFIKNSTKNNEYSRKRKNYQVEITYEECNISYMRKKVKYQKY